MTSHTSELNDFGWTSFFDSQLHPDERASALPARVMSVRRDRLHVVGPGVDTLISPLPHIDGDEESAAAAGDWLLLETRSMRLLRLLTRRSLFKRRAPGSARKLQLIAANVDTLFIVSSCNQDFNVARLERYLALASEAHVTPVVVLTKSDLTETPNAYVAKAYRLLPGLHVETLDARSSDGVAQLAPWCGRGRTVALLGSSGVGKSTLINTLTARDEIATQGIRADDDKGRHTTTARALHRMPAGGWLLDTPGMRELQLTDTAAGIADVFSEVAALAAACRFGDCQHETEPGCAVRAAIARGELDDERVRRWRKLVAEEAYNRESLAQRRARDRDFGKMVKRISQDKRSRRRE